MLEKIELAIQTIPDYMWYLFAGLLFAVIILSLFGNKFHKHISNRIIGGDE